MIYSLLLLPGLALSALGQVLPAPVITNNPSNIYTATLSDSPSTPIRGTVTASAGPGGVGLLFSVEFTGLPPDLGPFPYHVHVFPVPPDGNCTAAGEHLDPYNRGEEPPCDPSNPATCQIGDLSGKHGRASGSSFSVEYVDNYLSTDPGSNAFIGDKSIVIHTAGDERLNCGNFQLVRSAQAGTARLNVVETAPSSAHETSTRRPVPSSRPVTNPPVPTTRPVTSRPVPTSRPVTNPPVPTTRPVTSRPVPTSRPVTSPPVPTTRPVTSRPVPTTRPVTSRPVPTSRPVTSRPVPTTRPVTTSRPVPTSRPIPTSPPVPTTRPVTTRPVPTTRPVTTRPATTRTPSTRPIPTRISSHDPIDARTSPTHSISPRPTTFSTRPSGRPTSSRH